MAFRRLSIRRMGNWAWWVGLALDSMGNNWEYRYHCTTSAVRPSAVSEKTGEGGEESQKKGRWQEPTEKGAMEGQSGR
jgi:hypothetical protein